ncbi:putative phage abortive infection protein [Methylobrevis albus]|uniref:Phage abortive infection protein n=1 Tax=Methylobrevis albus TaxID=2793297 RepID=A0A931MWG0_9HYPH|nr:putative phage abortive infection protein [Methylobrevis albus]MBH0236888.1 hypothetical protein [Methylobrevis albus]
MQRLRNLLALLSLFLVMAVLYAANLFYGLNLSQSERGIFGDMFGAVNALFSGLACVGIGYAIFLQRQEIGLLRLDADRSRDLVEKQNVHMETQFKSMSISNRQETFFNLVNLLESIRSNLSKNNDDEDYLDDQGSLFSKLDAVTKHMSKAYIFETQIDMARRESNAEKAVEKYIAGEITRFTHEYNSIIKARYRFQFGKYFRFLLYVLKYVDEETGDHAKLYAGIVRSTMSDHELRVLFFHLATDVNELKGYFEKYSLFKDITLDTELSIQIKKRLYQSQAFH